MQRVPEPELMDTVEQAEAYHRADFSESHGKRVELFRERVPATHLSGKVLDLGCGSGDIVLRFARAFPGLEFVAIDGSAAMLRLAERELCGSAVLRGRIQLVQAFIPSDAIPAAHYSIIMSHSFLHHLHDPQVLWSTVKQFASKDTYVFVADLRRPDSQSEAKRQIDELAADEPDILQKDFYNSLCAAFTPTEIQRQLSRAGLSHLAVEAVGDIHVLVHGMMR